MLFPFDKGPKQACLFSCLWPVSHSRRPPALFPRNLIPCSWSSPCEPFLGHAEIAAGLIKPCLWNAATRLPRPSWMDMDSTLEATFGVLVADQPFDLRGISLLGWPCLVDETLIAEMKPSWVERYCVFFFCASDRSLLHKAKKLRDGGR